jgi:ADP-heptose:LPS heptosyltransferase
VDLAVDLTADRRSARLLEAMQPARAVGFDHPATRARLDSAISKECGSEHVARHMLRLAGLVGAAGDERLEFQCSDAARASAESWSTQGPAPRVAVHAGANRELRRWRLGHWVQLIGELRRKGIRVWALGGPGERAMLQALERAGAEVSPQGLTLDQTAARIACCELFIGNDSGPMHLASAVGAPVLSLFGPSLPETVAPPGPENYSIHVRMPCCPCDQRRCVQPKDFCLDRIPVDAVLLRAEQMIRGRFPGSLPEAP